MNEELSSLGCSGALLGACAAALCLVSALARAQDAGAQPSSPPASTTPAQTTTEQPTTPSQPTTPVQRTAPALPTAAYTPDPNPYYLGVGQGFTHDSNVYRVPSGPADTYSSTTVFGGFDQPISRQRVFGRAAVSLNRYFDEQPLNNTSYDFQLGAALETIENLSGGISLNFNQNLAAPTSGVNVPTPVSNVATTQRADARIRWGGPSLLTLEGSLGYVTVDYSAPQYVTSESNETTASIGLFYRPGALVRVGVAARFDRTRTPKAIVDPVDGTFRSNSTDGNNLDLLVDYTPDAMLTTNARLSYTRQTNSLLKLSDFSGFTGSLAIAWQPTAKTAVHLDAARDVGFQVSSVTQYVVVQSGTGLTLTPVAVAYQNNQVTDSAGVGVTYAATAKIGASAGLHYTRARLAATVEAGIGTGFVDVAKAATASVSYAINRAWNASCTVAYETRDVTALVSYSYTANVIGCATQFTWH
jgi:hypothetical protein